MAVMERTQDTLLNQIKVTSGNHKKSVNVNKALMDLDSFFFCNSDDSFFLPTLLTASVKHSKIKLPMDDTMTASA